MKIIDSHIHYSNIKSFKDTAKTISNVDYSLEGYKRECNKNNVVSSIIMGVEEKESGGFPDSAVKNPMMADLDKLDKNMNLCLGINPDKILNGDKLKELERINGAASQKNVVGIKIYAGYYWHNVYDEVYKEAIDIARKNNLTVVIHSGETYSTRGRLKYSRPIDIDEIAVEHPDVKFVICHMGDPWIMDAAEVAAKNDNVWIDVSGLIVGDRLDVQKYLKEELFLNHIKRGFSYTNDWSRFLYGSDWPLCSMDNYIEFIKNITPESKWEKVFYKNALEVFNKLIV